MVLLDLIARSRKDILVINIEHGIRGEESLEDSLFVNKYCRLRNIPCVVECVKVLEECAKTKESPELCARRLRYEVFNKYLDSGEVDLIALAHNAWDNTETVLMRIIRGTGIKGLKGITDHGKFIHPLLPFSRTEIERYAYRRAIPYVTDSTNNENDYTRNYLRNEILAPLRERFGSLDASFAKLSQNSSEADGYISSHIIPFESDGDALCFSQEAFEKEHSIVLKYSVNNLLKELGILQDIESRHLEYILSLAGKEVGSEIDLPFGITCAKEYGRVSFYKKQEIEPFEAEFSLSGKISFCGAEYFFEKGSGIVPKISFDAEKIPYGAVIRTRKDGDTFKKCNGKTKKLVDFFNERKIPVRNRRRLLVLADGGEVLAVLGEEVGDRIKITDETKEIYYIRRNDK